MSLILEALKKLERDKQVEGRSGFLVMAARPWPSPGEDRRGMVWVVAGALAMMAIGAGLALWLWRGGTAPPAVAQAPVPMSSAPASLPAPAAVAPSPAHSAAAPAAAPTASVAERKSPPLPRIVSPPPIRDDAPARAPVADIPATAAAVVAPAVPPARYRLTAISERDGKPVAMLNERLVFEGDSFDDVTVVKIGVSDVELKVAGKTVVVPF